MAHLIDKDALVAEIERLYSAHSCKYGCDEVGINLEYLEDFIDTLEVKEVDVEKEARHYLLYEHSSPLNEIMHQADLKAEIQYHEDIENAYKAGFELGLKAQKGE